ncbi:MAG: DUF4252 domain-containing protein [Pseudomonadota bacterium]
MFKSKIKASVFAMLMLTGLIASSAQAQDGYFNIDGLTAGLQPKVNINFGPAMMAGFAETMGNSNPDMSTVLGGIYGVRLMVFEDLDDTSDLAVEIDLAVNELIGEGWTQALQVREDDEQVDLFMLESGQYVTGMVLMVRESNETVVMANIHGEMDPVLVGRMVGSGNMFDGFDLDSIFEGNNGD